MTMTIDEARFVRCDVSAGADGGLRRQLLAQKCNADAAASTNVFCRPDQEVTPMSLPHEAPVVPRFYVDPRLDEPRAVNRATLPVGLGR